MTRFVRNAAGRMVPTVVNGTARVPFKGVGKYRPAGTKTRRPIRTCAQYPTDGNKLQPSLESALRRAGLRDGMTISTHHHLRNGDRLTNHLFDVVHRMGVRNIRWFPSASFPCHEHLLPYLKDGTIHHIEGSMNGPLGRFASEGGMHGVGVLRSHGGRYQAIQDGEVHIDIAIIAAPAADSFGNANGLYGDSSCGVLGFALADSEYADRVIIVSDNIVPFPCVPWQIQGNNVDMVVLTDNLGDSWKIVSGTTQITNSPDRLLIAEYVSLFVEQCGIIRDGFSFQAGAGGISLAVIKYLRDRMVEKGIKARFVRGGSTKHLVSLLEDGLTDYILDGQMFDRDSVRSMRTNPRHVATSPFTSYNYHGKGNFASMLDFVVLGATEIDLSFNANVVTHSDGYLLHGIGGWQDCLFSKCTILAVPSLRDRIPVIVDEVTTLCGPSELIDVVVTERGIAINPRRKDLISATRKSSLPIRSLRDIQKEIFEICEGSPEKPQWRGKGAAAIVKWVDGTVLDTVHTVK